MQATQPMPLPHMSQVHPAKVLSSRQAAKPQWWLCFRSLAGGLPALEKPALPMGTSLCCEVVPSPEG